MVSTRINPHSTRSVRHQIVVVINHAFASAICILGTSGPLAGAAVARPRGRGGGCTERARAPAAPHRQRLRASRRPQLGRAELLLPRRHAAVRAVRAAGAVRPAAVLRAARGGGENGAGAARGGGRAQHSGLYPDRRPRPRGRAHLGRRSPRRAVPPGGASLPTGCYSGATRAPADAQLPTSQSPSPGRRTRRNRRALPAPTLAHTAIYLLRVFFLSRASAAC